MFIPNNLPASGRPVNIIVHRENEETFRRHHFRGTQVAKAGNFLLWETLREAFHEEPFVRQLLMYVEECARAHRFGNFSLELVHEFPVGWSSVDDLKNYEEEDLEPYCPHHKLRILRIRIDHTHLKAPKTSTVFINGHITRKLGAIQCTIHTMRPGKGIGKLEGNISQDRGVIFFDWEHPGEL